MNFEKESRLRLKSIKNSDSFTHQQIEDKYNRTIVMPHLEEKKKRLK